MKFSVVIPTYNHCDDLLKPCIESIFQHTDLNDIELIIVANGCRDNTMAYLGYVYSVFAQAGCPQNCVVLYNDEPLGYAGACNMGIRSSKTDKIILLNNDTVLLDQPKNRWLEILDGPFSDPECGISCIIKSRSDAANRDFAVFFCVAVRKAVFDKIGLLSEEYGVGGMEDVDFCMQAENAGFKISEVFEKHWDGRQFTGGFPIYHKGEGTVHDATLVPDWDKIFLKNTLKVAKKYNPEWYRFKLSNDYERAVFLKGDPVFFRESARYQWAAKNIYGPNVLEIGCSTGYGVQFLPQDINYLGLDYDPIIVDVAKEQEWHFWANFEQADINTYPLGKYDTIIAFEIVEHIDNGLEIVEKLKQHCKVLLLTVPYNEPPGFWGHHHKLHGLNESHFPGFQFVYSNEHGIVTDVPEPIGPNNRCNIMFCRWVNE
jgi:glycosyltransferase involved in cell wall biosynthesis